MPGKYAGNTKVSVYKSREEIERHLGKYGATGYRYTSIDNGQTAIIEFSANDKAVRLKLELPNKDQFYKTPGGRRRRENEAALKAWEQACRSHWRALAKYIQMTLEAIEIGIVKFDEVFLPYFILPDNSTVADQVLPKLSEMLIDNKHGFKLLLKDNNQRSV